MTGRERTGHTTACEMNGCESMPACQVATLLAENMILRGLVRRIVDGPQKHLKTDARAYLRATGERTR